MSDLAWGTPTQNTADARRHGRLPFGERNGNAKLTQGDVDAIRAAYTGVRGQKAALARQYGIARSTVWDILEGRRWPARAAIYAALREGR